MHSLNVNKAHICDDIPIRLFKTCNSTVVKLLSIVFRKTGTFTSTCKKSNVFIQKKRDKQIFPNYCPVSLLITLGKIFERIVFNPTFEFLDKNNLLIPNQSGFCPSDSCQNQLLLFVHKIYSDSDQYRTPEVRAQFLDISILKLLKYLYSVLESSGDLSELSGDLYSALESFLTISFQRVDYY